MRSLALDAEFLLIPHIALSGENYILNWSIDLYAGSYLRQINSSWLKALTRKIKVDEHN
jgi:hypothetical protein